MKLKWWVLSLAAGGVVLVVGGPFLYFRFVAGDAPANLALSSSSPAAGSTDVAVSGGRWAISSGSVVGYRVKETLFGQSGEAVGRTEVISGSILIDGATVTEASFTVDMTTVASDQRNRDNQFHGRIMKTSTYPTATFRLTEPIELGTLPPSGETRNAKATGGLTVHGVTKNVTFDLSGRSTGTAIEVAGSIPIVFADYEISNPSGGPAQTGDDGLLEFALNLTAA